MNRAFWTASLLAVLFCLLAAIGTPWGAAVRLEVIYVLDVSRSHGPAPDLLQGRLRQWHAQSALAGSPFRVIRAGTTAIENGALPPGFTEGSRVDLGLALARRTRGAADRVVVLSDGRFDHELVAQEVAALAAEHVAVWFAGPVAEPALDMRILPRGAATVEGGRARVRAGVTGTNREPRAVTLTVTGGDQTGGGRIVVLPGAIEEWEALVPIGAAVRALKVRIVPDGGPDAAPANDELEIPVARERLRALVVGVGSGLQRPTIVEALGESGVEIDQLEDLTDLTSPRLAGVDLLVLVDQPVAGVQAERLAEVEAAVMGGGVGLWVVGGEHAFGAGGYAATRFDDLLPLSSRSITRDSITVILDTSGSMEQDDRIGRAIDAIAALAQGLAPDDRLQVVPFAQEAAAPVPATPAAPQDFLATAIPVLRRIAPRGGTHLLPALDAALARPRSEDRKNVFIIITDARDDQVGDRDLFVRQRAMLEDKIDSIVVLLDANDETQKRARMMATQGVITVGDYGPRLLVHLLEGEAFVLATVAGIDSVLPDGTAGPRIAWRNRAREGQDALVLLATKEHQPLMASAFRGVGRTAAWAAWPLERHEAVTLAREWALKTARPAEWKRIAARREGDRLVMTMPSAAVPRGGLLARGGGRGEPIPLQELAPGVFDLPGGGRLGPHLTILEGERVFAVVPVPPAGDPEYAWPPFQPGPGPEQAAGPAPRLRAPWGVLAVLAWALALVLRRGGA